MCRTSVNKSLIKGSKDLTQMFQIFEISSWKQKQKNKRCVYFCSVQVFSLNTSSSQTYLQTSISFHMNWTHRIKAGMALVCREYSVQVRTFHRTITTKTWLENPQIFSHHVVFSRRSAPHSSPTWNLSVTITFNDSPHSKINYLYQKKKKLQHLIYNYMAIRYENQLRKKEEITLLHLQIFP